MLSRLGVWHRVVLAKWQYPVARLRVVVGSTPFPQVFSAGVLQRNGFEGKYSV